MKNRTEIVKKRRNRIFTVLERLLALQKALLRQELVLEKYNEFPQLHAPDSKRRAERRMKAPEEAHN
jgi:hypothetical protein